MRRHIYLILLCITSIGFGQESKIERAAKNFDKFNFVNAQEIYERVVEKGFASADLYKKLADSYYLNAKYDDASTYYEKLTAEFPDQVDAETYFRYAISLRSIKDYTTSDKMMLRFFELNENDTRGMRFKRSPDYLNEIDAQKDSYDVKITSINSGFSDFGSTLYKNKLIFASNRDSGTATTRRHNWNGQPFLNLYQVDLTKVDEDNGYKFVEKFSSTLNTPFHESTPVFTKDEKTVYFTRNNYNKGNYKDGDDGTNRLKLYSATLIRNRWSKVHELPFNSDNYTVSHPALSVDEKRLYFSSNMPGSIGQTDLWYVSILEDGTYGSPVNLGNQINTEGVESFPFISSENDLYFASNGHPGLGGLDLFITSLNDDTKQILNLGEPANTSKDDFAFTYDTDRNLGFLSSNRDNTGVNDDIYMVKKLKRPALPCEIILSGVITDAKTGEFIEGTTVSLLDVDNNVIKSVTTSAAAAFAFLPDCEKIVLVRAQKEGYNPTEVMVTTPALSAEIERNLTLEKTLQPLNTGDDIAKILNLNPIYFDFDKFNIRSDAAVELAKVLVFMETYPSKRIDVRSHTDSRGNDAYNRSLSQNRNVSTRQWLIAQGVDASRLSGRGYGESVPVNNCINGVSCSEEEHQLNRRSEFIIVE